MRFKLSAITILIVLGLIYSCRRPAETLRIIHAGSLTIPVKEAADSFMKLNPGVRVLTEAWGSKAGARRVSDLDVPCDLFISADYKVIDNFLIPGHASWNISFAGNEMAIVFNTRSRYSDEIRSDNWYEILLRDDVIYGRSDPDSDPCGVRAVLTTMLAERHYEEPYLSERLLSRHGNYIRPKETDLLALLDRNALDYIFIYRSVALQHGLQYVVLPEEISLKNPALNPCYAEVDVELAGLRPGESIRETGEAMVYGITIPHKSDNKSVAKEFVKYFLSGKGMEILERNGQNGMIPSVSSTYGNIPKELREFALPAN